MKAFGPRRLVEDAEGARLVDNDFSLLDVADLVFIDPPGTGASMPLAGADVQSLFSVSGDARAVAEVVEAMASHRPYRPALSIDEALSEIDRYRNSLYDTHVVDACLKIFRNNNFKFD